MADARRIAEAEKCVKDAQKALKTSMLALKFSPDHDTAATLYERAAVCYKNASKKEDCKQMYINAAQQHELNGTMFKSACNKEQAAYMCRDLNDMALAKTLMEQAARIYEECGTSETAVGALEKAAKFFEEQDEDKAIEIYRKAHYMTQETDKVRQQTEFLHRLMKLYIRKKDYAQAIWAVQSSIDVYAGAQEGPKVAQLTSVAVLLHLMIGKPDDADNVLSKSAEVDGFMSSEDRHTCPQLIEAYRGGDAKTWKAVVNKPHMRHHDNDVLRMIPLIQLPAKVKGFGAINQDEVDAQDSDDDLR